jgi:tetratricopeptide (TPR) repeat protein/DNA-binding Xre family transcriptional regulator
VFKEVWADNVRHLLRERGLTVAEAARAVGTSKQYLSAILAEEASSTRETVMERLCMLLHTTPADLFTPVPFGGKDETDTASLGDVDSVSPVELAIRAERHLLAGEYLRAYSEASALLLRHESELAPGARAQVLLLAGRAGCLAGVQREPLTMLREALTLFQKRLSSQPEKYLPLSMDCYRYMGLACYSLGEYGQASRYFSRVCALAERYPELAVDLEAKIESAVSQWLRSAMRQGKLQGFFHAYESARSMANRFSFNAILRMIEVERLFCLYPLALVWGKERRVLDEFHGRECEGLMAQWSSGPLSAVDVQQAIQYALLLHLSDHEEALSHLQQLLQRSMASRGLVSAVMEGLLVLSRGDEANYNRSLGRLRQSSFSDEERNAPALVHAASHILQGLLCERLNLLVSAHLAWQSALGTLRSSRDLPTYVLGLQWYLQTTAQHLDEAESAISRELLQRTLSFFASGIEEEHLWP